MKQIALPNRPQQRWLAGGKSYHHPLVAPRAQYDAPGCVIRSLHDAKVLRDQRPRKPSHTDKLLEEITGCWL